MTSDAHGETVSREPSAEAADPAVGGHYALPLGALALAEAAALGARFAAGGTTTLLDLVIIHMLTLFAVGGIVLHAQRTRRDATYPLIALIAAAPMGPLGLAGAAILQLASTNSSRTSPLIAQWYDRIALSTAVAPAERLCDDVEVGRTLDLEGRPPISDPDAMTSGSIAERQAILGHIARHFDPAYLAALKIALASEEPLIRVQAAAVAAHIAPRVHEHAVRSIAEAELSPADPLRALALLGDLEALIASGLLDETDRINAERQARNLGDRVLASLSGGPLPLPYSTDAAHAAELDLGLERLLISRHRFADLRAHRTARRLRQLHPGVRLRRHAAPNRLPEAAQ